MPSSPRKDRILVVDDSSPDGTGDAVLSFAETGRVFLLSRPVKNGLGQAYVAGFGWALAHPEFDIVVQMYADFSHAPDSVPELIKALGEFDFVIGSRYCNGVNFVNWPLHRLMLSWFANKYSKLVTTNPKVDILKIGHSGEIIPSNEVVDYVGTFYLKEVSSL